MAIEHAIGDAGGAAHEGAVRSPEAKVGNGTAGGKAPPKGALAAFRRLLSPFSRRHGWSAWRVTAVAVLVYVGAVNLSYFLVLKPIWTRLNVLVEKKSVIQDFLIVRESASAVSAFKDGLMHGDQRMTVVSEFEDLGRQAGLRMIVEPGLLPPKELSKKLMEYPVEIDLRGTYHEVGHFLSLLSSSPRCPIVRDVEVTASEGGSGQCDVRLLIGIASWVD